jgi:hypothetical protein
MTSPLSINPATPSKLENKEHQLANKSLLFVASLCLFSFTASAQAATVCELPSDIDDGESYWIKFKNQQPLVYELNDIEDCWIRVMKRGDKTEYWYPITNVESITAAE